MADTLKVLSQSLPAAGALTNLYTVPSLTSTVVSSLIICNEGSTATTFRVSIAPAGAADALSQYIYYDVPLAANDTFIFTGGISLATTGVVRVRSASGLVAFSLFGVEVT